MQELLTIARPYAAAAFDYASEHNDVDAWSDALQRLGTAVDDPQLAPFIGHPRVSDDALREIVADVLGGTLNDARRNFLDILIRAERLELAPQVSELFERLRAEAAGTLQVEVTSAFPLNDQERDAIDAAVRSRLGRNCSVESDVDAALIGGAIVKIGDSVIDLSLRGRLAALEQELA